MRYLNIVNLDVFGRMLSKCSRINWKMAFMRHCVRQENFNVATYGEYVGIVTSPDTLRLLATYENAYETYFWRPSRKRQWQYVTGCVRLFNIFLNVTYHEILRNRQLPTSRSLLLNAVSQSLDSNLTIGRKRGKDNFMISSRWLLLLNLLNGYRETDVPQGYSQIIVNEFEPPHNCTKWVIFRTSRNCIALDMCLWFICGL